MFISELQKYNWDQIENEIKAKTENDVLRALNTEKANLEDFKALISPAAKPYLEQMASLSNKLTQKRFGKTTQLFIPLYLTNVCENLCVYCGFNHENKIKRIVLNKEQILKEVEVIKSYGFEHILLVTGEAPKVAGVDYLMEVIKLIKPYFSQISIEVQPMDQKDYEKLISVGLNSVYVYQETYHQQNYTKYHLKGKKSNFDYRLHTPDRLGKAGIHKIGLGTLIGLEEWRTDAFFTALHLSYLEKRYWQTKYCISLPRLRPHIGGFQANYPITDRELLQLICAYRIFNHELEISISVRESIKFRDNIVKLGVTNFSAGSKTEPGGYANNTEALEQFEVHDNRTPQEVAKMIQKSGYDPIWKDWDYCLQ